LELPDNSVLLGTISMESTSDFKTVYITNKGWTLDIYSDEIYITTDEDNADVIAYTYFLDN
jgi:hypothetical protein